MNVAEILRALADKIASVEQQVPHQDQSAQLHAVEVDNVDDTESNLMVPPLQQKLELMKKLAGEEGHDHACEECGCDPCECDAGHEDEMEIMKRNAGIAPVVVALADEDEPFES